MKKLRLLFSLLPVCLFFAAGPAHAAKMPKVDICHFDAEEGIYKKSAVSGNAMQPHLDHGDVIPGVDNEPPLPDLDDDCFAIIVPDPIARAYIDVDHSGDYDATKDVDIAVLHDTDGSDGLSVGDTIELGQYPKDFNPCPTMSIPSCDLGTFNNTTHIVTSIVSSGGSFTYAVKANSLLFSIGKPPITGDLLQLLDEGGAPPNPEVTLFDITEDEFSSDIISVGSSALWNPSDLIPTQHDTFGTGESDSHFIDVIIY